MSTNSISLNNSIGGYGNSTSSSVQQIEWLRGKKVMGFWLFMLIMDLLIPLTMIVFGRYFLKKAPKDINGVFGYRTTMSMKNKETWNYAHNYCGKIWYYCGLVMLPVSIIVMIFTFGKAEDFIGTVGGSLCFIQMIPLVGSIFPTEIALKKTFDKNGKRR